MSTSILIIFLTYDFFGFLLLHKLLEYVKYILSLIKSFTNLNYLCYFCQWVQGEDGNHESVWVSSATCISCEAPRWQRMDNTGCQQLNKAGCWSLLPNRHWFVALRILQGQETLVFVVFSWDYCSMNTTQGKSTLPKK